MSTEVFANIPVPSANGVGASVDVSTMAATKTIIVGGTFAATVTIEYSNDPGAVNWAPVANSSFVNGPGRVTIELASHWVRARTSGYKSGSANADIGAVYSPASFVQLTGIPADISTMPPFKTVMVTGACNVEVSEDGVSYSQVFSFQNAGAQNAVVIAQFARVTNGVTCWLAAADPGVDGTSGDSPALYTVNVAKNGNNATADGSIGRPFLTVQAAMEYAWTTYVAPAEPQPASPFIRPCVFVHAGTYDDGALVLPPQICVAGEGYNHSRIVGNWSIDTRWSNYVPPALPSPPSVLVPSDFRSTWLNVGLFGNVVANFDTVVSNEGKLYSSGVRFGGTVTITEKTEAPVSNQIVFTDSEFIGDVTLNGIVAIFQSCISLGGILTLNQAVGTGVDNVFQSSGGSLGAIVINSTNALAPVYTCTFDHVQQPATTLTLNGTFSAISASLASVPLQSDVVLAGGAVLNQVLRTNQLNWSGVTADRPPAPYVGQQYFDTTLGRPVWWDGAAWIV